MANPSLPDSSPPARDTPGTRADERPARRERSAGVIVFRTDLFGHREYLLLDYGRHWDYPKGHIEPGESDLDAARRELHEETGLNGVEILDGFGREIRYVFRVRAGKRGRSAGSTRVVHKTVTYFLGRSNGADVRLSAEHHAFAWLPFDEAMRQISHASSRDVLRHAEAFLAGQVRAS
jgi:8-oxo-dGTP pyrophosphatase MutT (NUDIX family)